MKRKLSDADEAAMVDSTVDALKDGQRLPRKVLIEKVTLARKKARHEA